MSEHDRLTPEERELARLLRKLPPHGAPSSTLDERILGAAHAAIEDRGPTATGPIARPKRPRRLAVIGVAASLLLAVGIAWQLRPIPPSRSPADANVMSSSSADVMAASGAEHEPDDARTTNPGATSTQDVVQPSPLAEPSKQAADSAPPASSAEPALAPKPATDASPRQRTNSAPVVTSQAPRLRQVAPPDPPAPPAPPLPQTLARPVDSAADNGAESDANANATLQPDRFEAAPTMPSAQMKRTQEAASKSRQNSPSIEQRIAVDAQLSRHDWLQRIRQRRDQGDIVGARASLALFRHEHRFTRIPQDLRSLLPD